MRPVVGTQLTPGELAETVERRWQIGGLRWRHQSVAEQRNQVRAAGQRVGEFAPHRIGRIGDAQLPVIVGGGQQLRREQKQKHRLGPERSRNFVAPADAGAQIVLVEEDLLVAKQGAEIARQGGCLVLAIGGPVADEQLGH